MVKSKITNQTMFFDYSLFNIAHRAIADVRPLTAEFVYHFDKLMLIVYVGVTSIGAIIPFPRRQKISMRLIER